MLADVAEDHGEDGGQKEANGARAQVAGEDRLGERDADGGKASAGGEHDDEERGGEEVGEGGSLLSVGQKQLISLARAILAQPEIIIMDEATSSIDTITEGLIQKGIYNMLRDCTSFVIAHRLSTIRYADRILVIENGSIGEAGSHDELIALKGHYFNLYTRQFRNEGRNRNKRH